MVFILFCSSRSSATLWGGHTPFYKLHGSPWELRSLPPPLRHLSSLGNGGLAACLDLKQDVC